MEEDYDALVAAERAKADKIKLMKKEGSTSPDELMKEIAQLKAIRELIASKTPTDDDFSEFNKKGFV